MSCASSSWRASCRVSCCCPSRCLALRVRYWVRNLARRSTSFRLQTATDWFYPDFLCLLT
ncbi:MAG: hypothetical protein MUF04_12775 [Akkermansiaceae bacterium]|nr:hypothetical protein [Akkermansiaceae bacterium]